MLGDNARRDRLFNGRKGQEKININRRMDGSVLRACHKSVGTQQMANRIEGSSRFTDRSACQLNATGWLAGNYN
ncbi:unnamed protein product [Onchocerca flexuosa]|uniref:Uncharacterized protein n=1 Tax=Onchocerca flexuosa TaxID=387005 RepID=A0A183H0B2_9BILA|nr:unnamed protein product [Onchocerca flexuosa]